MKGPLSGAVLCGVVAISMQRPFLKLPPERVDDLLGHSVCELPPESEPGMYRVPLPAAGYRLEYRKRWRFEAVFLVEMKQEAESCRDRIVAAIRLPAHGAAESINFECTRKGGSPGEVVIGIVPDAESSAEATPAWRVDLPRRSFELVRDRPVVCSNVSVDR
jgi:hypothetical protein